MLKKLNTFSNNVFNIEKIGKKEFLEMINNLCTTIEKLGYISGEVTLEEPTIRKLNEFGIITEKQPLEMILKTIKKDQLNKLISSINSILDIDIYSEYDLVKYNLEIRNELVEKERNSGKFTLVDLFSGAGGLSLGFIQNNFRVIFANDIEKSALRTYSFNHPEVPGEFISIGGIEDIAHNIHEYINEKVDVLVGGPPCQGFSSANRQRLIDDPRNILYKYYVEAVINLKPKVFVMENVKGMKNVADQVVEDFNSSTEVKYDISYILLNAKKFEVPQNRERLIFIGIRSDISSDSKETSLSLIEKILQNNEKKEKNLMDAINDLPPLEASRIKNSTEIDTVESGAKIDRVCFKDQTEYINKINGSIKSKLIFNHKARYNNDRDIEIFGRMLQGDNSQSERIADIMPYKSRNHMFKDKYFKLVFTKPCKTITAHMKFDCNMYIHPTQSRGLTPREAARVQSFPDDYFFLGPYTKTYMQIGNAVPPLLSKVISTKIIDVLKNIN